MIKYILHIILFLSFAQLLHSQEGGVTSFKLPFRNSLTFNKYTTNPTFSFVREQNKYISFSNKRELVQFDNAPQSYLFGYSGRLRENMGFGIGLYQQDYGVLTTFGGVLNYAYNVVLDRYSNLTFGLNIGFYKSGINKGNVITNIPEPLLETIPSNMLVTINPGINYGTTFLDFGLSLNNFALYNISASKLIEEDPERGIQAHIMYTGYIENRGLFDNAKFSGLIRSEFKRKNTIVSGIMMLMIPKGVWAQVGYNSFYGASAGIGLNLTNHFSIEYNFEKTLGELSNFGPSHEIVLAYKFKNKHRYYYGDVYEVGAIIPEARKRVTTSKRTRTKQNANKTKLAARAKAEKQAELLAETKAKEETKAREAADEAIAKSKEEDRVKAEKQAEILAETKAKEEVKTREAAEVAERLVPIPVDPITVSMNELTQLADDSKIKQEELLSKLRETVASRTQDLNDLKDENDLSDKGIYKEPKPFKSITAENTALEALKIDIDNVINEQDIKIKKLETLYNDRLKNISKEQDSISTIYLDEILILKTAQSKARRTKLSLVSELEAIGKALEIERKRRIKRAAYDNPEDRYTKDMATLNRIKQTSTVSSVPLNSEDFDFGEELGNNVIILKDVQHIESGYYLVLAVHGNIVKRDDFLRKTVASGQADVNFFYDVNTSKYYIYFEKFDSIEAAGKAMQLNDNKPYKSKMTMVKIEN